MRTGTVYRHSAFYVDPDTGEIKAKYLVVLGRIPGGDIVARLLTSRPHGRPEQPPCYHGDPYPGFFLGTPGGPLTMPTWVDLRRFDDLDDVEASALMNQGVITPVLELPAALMRPLLECAAAADDTTRLQERAMRDALAPIARTPR